MNPADLIARYAARRDAQAFAELVRDYQSMVLATCRRRVVASGDVDDAVQETFLKLAWQAGTLRTNVAAWLHRCATNVAADLNRRGEARRRHESAAASAGSSADESADASRELAELREHLDAALDRLDEAQRELILQRFFVGRSQVELAAEANVSPSAISQRLDRAIDALRTHLAASGAIVAGAGIVETLSAEHASARVAPALTAKLNAIGLSGAPPATGLAAGTLWSALAAAALLAVTAAALWWTTRPASSLVALASTTQTTQGAQTSGGLTVRPDANSSASATPDWRGPTTPGGVLSGRITDADGKPVAGATVALDEVRNSDVTTEADGVYRFAAIPSDGDYHVTVDATNFVPVDAIFVGRNTLRLSQNAQAVRNIVLQRAHLVTVLVDVADGATLDDLLVSYIPIVNRGDERRSDASERYAYRKRGEDEITIALPVGETPYAIMATAKDHAPAFAIVTPTTTEASNVTITLDAGLTVEGTATCNDGKPATGWEICAKPTSWPSPGTFPIPFAKIDDSGHFTLAHVPAGKHEFSIEIPNGDMWSGSPIGTFDLTDARLAIAVPMNSPASLATIRGKLKWVGEMTDANGININVTGGEHRRYYSTMLRTDPKRRPASFEIANVDPGEYTIRFESTTIEPVKLEHVKVPGELPEVTLRAVQKSRLGGTVVDEQSGRPVTNFAFRVRKISTIGHGPNWGQSADWIQVADANGAFVADLVGPGEYQVQVSAGGYAWRWSEVARVETPGALATTALKLNHGGGLRGVVLAPDGKPVIGARVIPFSMAQSTDVSNFGTMHFEGEAGAVITDASGRYALDHLNAGDETLKIVHADFVALVTPAMRVVADQASDALPTTLRVGASVVGTVYDANGQPQQNVVIAFRDKPYYGPNESTLLGSATTDASGRYRVDHLPSQAIYATVDDHVQHGGVWRRAVRPRDGQTATLDIGGASTLTGRLVDGAGKPRAARDLMFTTGDRIFGATIASVKPAADGRFTIRGLPSGRYSLSVDVESIADDIVIRDVTIDDRATLDLGDVVDDRGRIAVTAAVEDPADAAKSVTLTSDPSAGGNGLTVGTFQQDGDRWVCDDVPAGRWIVVARGADYSDVGATAIDRRAGDGERQFTIALPKRTATIRYVPSTQPTNGYAELIDAAGIERTGIGGGPVTVRVPPGTYRITAGDTQRPRGDVAPIVVAAGETRDLALPPGPMPVTALVYVWSADGTLVTDAHVSLVDAQGTAITAVPSIAYELSAFPVVPGRYSARIARAGAAIVERAIDVGTPPVSAWTSPVTCDVVLP